jgi:hypothetical protein
MQITEKSKLNVWSKTVEMFKGEYYINSIELAKNTSKLAQSEDNDCVVRAFMAALDISYDQAHAWVKNELKRQNRKGTSMYNNSKNIIGKTKNGKKINFIGSHPSKDYYKHSFGSDKVLANKQYKKATGYTLKSFMETNPVGRFVLIVQGHAVAVVNGVLYGNSNDRYNGLYRSVWFAFECK